MSVKKDASGRRTVELQFELPGTPEQIWQAIATGPGISSWLFPTDVEEHEGGAVAFHIGPGMESSGHVTTWEPPKRFAYEELGWSGDAAPLGTEFIIEAQAGGTCKVRLVHSLFASDDTWDNELEGFESGWPGFFNVLRLYLTHFPGQRSAAFRPMRPHPGSQAEAWDVLLKTLGLSGARVGDHRNVSMEGTPPLAGTVERIEQADRHREVTLRLDPPSPGIALIGTFALGQQVHVAISLYFYGDDAATIAAREEPRWQAWLDRHFPRVDQKSPTPT